MPITTSNDQITSTKWDDSNETHHGYKTWINKVSLWANNHDMAWIMKITKRLQEAPNFRRPVSRAPREQFFDEAQAAREELIAEIQRSTETDAGEDPADDEQADDVTFGHKMMYPAAPDWNVTSDDFADEDLASLLRGDGKKKIDLLASMHMLKLQCLTAKLGKTAWNDLSSMHVPDTAALGVLHSQIMAQELRTLNSTFVSSLRNNLFGIKPRTGRHGDRLQLLYPMLYGPHIDALLQDNEEELDSHVWFDKPWRMPAVKAWAAILRLATSSEGIGTGMFLADLKALIDASSAPDGITAHELDARAEGVLKVCDQFTSVSALKDFIRSCLRAEAIKSVAARGDKIGFAHGQANNFLITKRLEGGGLSLKDTQYALDLAARFMAEDSKPTPTPAKTYLTGTADLALNIDDKTEQKEHSHVAQLLRNTQGRWRSRPQKRQRTWRSWTRSRTRRRTRREQQWRDPWPANFSRQ